MLNFSTGRVEFAIPPVDLVFVVEDSTFNCNRYSWICQLVSTVVDTTFEKVSVVCECNFFSWFACWISAQVEFAIPPADLVFAYRRQHNCEINLHRVGTTFEKVSVVFECNPSGALHDWPEWWMKRALGSSKSGHTRQSFHVSVSRVESTVPRCIWWYLKGRVTVFQLDHCIAIRTTWISLTEWNLDSLRNN